METRVALLVRNYNRPKYLRETLDSLLRADIDLCCERLIYDDCSSDSEVMSLLCDPSLISVPTKAFTVVRGSSNLGCKNSFNVALNALSSSYDFICTVDNDVHVKSNFISTLIQTYQDAYKVYNTNHMLLTGFNPSNTHRNHIKSFDTFYRKRTCGGVNFFFHRSFKPFIVDKWNINLDWGVVHSMENYNYPLVCTKPGVVQHIGVNGLNSNERRFDRDDSF